MAARFTFSHSIQEDLPAMWHVSVVLGRLQRVLAHSFLSFIGVGVAVEIGSGWVKAFVKNEVETEKIVGYVTRGGESEDGVAVEVGRAWVKLLEKFGRAVVARRFSVWGPCRVYGSQVGHPCIWPDHFGVGVTASEVRKLRWRGGKKS